MANKSNHNSGRSWSADRRQQNKSESWEKPMNQRKNRFDNGGVSERFKGISFLKNNEVVSEFDEKDLVTKEVMDYVADEIERGYTNGKLVGDNYGGYWRVDIGDGFGNDAFKGSPDELKEVAKLIREGNVSGSNPKFTFSANVWNDKEEKSEYEVSGRVWYATYESAGDDYDQITTNVLTKDEFDEFMSDGKIEKTHFQIKAKYDWQIRDKIYAEMAENDEERGLDYEQGRHIIGYNILLDNQDSGFGDDLPYEVDEDDDNDLEFRNGGGVGKHFVGTFNEEQLKRKEDKVAIEKAMKETGLKYIDSKIVKKKGKMYMEVYLIPNEEYYKSSKFSSGGGINSGRDFLFKSKQPHEQNYKRKTEWKEYKKEGWFGNWFDNGGGVGDNKFEYVLWDDVRRDMKYPESDDNGGFIFGVNLLDENNEVLDVQWFDSEEERDNFISENGLEEVDYDSDDLEFRNGGTYTTSRITSRDEAVESFLTQSKPFSYTNISVNFTPDGKGFLFQYGTLIAKRTDDSVSINEVFYSKTTSILQNLIGRKASEKGMKVSKVTFLENGGGVGDGFSYEDFRSKVYLELRKLGVEIKNGEDEATVILREHQDLWIKMAQQGKNPSETAMTLNNISSKFKNGGGVGEISSKRERVIDYFLDTEDSDSLVEYYGVSEDLVYSNRDNNSKELRDAIIKYHHLDNDKTVIEKFNDLGLEEFATGGNIMNLGGRRSYSHFKVKPRTVANRAENIPKAKSGNIELIQTEYPISFMEEKLGRKINSWKDDVIMVEGMSFKKCYLRPYYELIK